VFVIDHRQLVLWTSAQKTIVENLAQKLYLQETLKLKISKVHTKNHRDKSSQRNGANFHKIFVCMGYYFYFLTVGTS
jgi:hypothetical protein